MLDDSNKIKFEYLEDTLLEIENLDKEVLSFMFLKRVQSSFFVLDSSEKWTFDTLSSIIFDLTKTEVPKEVILNIEKWIWITWSYIFPFLRSEQYVYNINWAWNTDIENYLRNFKTDIYPYLCIMPVKNKYILFTDIKEEHIIKYLPKYNFNELHKIIPKMIDSLKDKVDGKKVDIKEMGVSFPLSMIWYHSHIQNKLKKWVSISNDISFINLIKYWLLDYLKIKTKYTISFNNDREKNKFRLHWKLFDITEAKINNEVLEHLELFIDDISINLTSWEKRDKKGIFNLPIYIVSWKYSYRKEDWYPLLNYDSVKEKLTLKLPELPESLLVTWIFPQYLKLLDWSEVAYLKYMEDVKNWEEIEDYDFESDFFKENKQWFLHEFLREIRNRSTNMYTYINEDKGWTNPSLNVSDFFITARLWENNQEYLLNITDPKTKRGKDKHILTIDIYELSYTDFEWERISQSIIDFDIVKDSKKIGSLEINDKSNWKYSQINLVNNIEQITDTVLRVDNIEVTKRKGKWKVDYYNKPSQFKDFKYIPSELKFEDLISLAFIRLLNISTHWNCAMFWGKGISSKSRELADIISVKINNEDVLLDLYHMKIAPFTQTKTSLLKSSFSQYTQVVWQALEKSKAFIYKQTIEEVFEWIESYFLNNEEKADNYEIFETITKKLPSKVKNLHVVIYFAVRYEDYFWPIESIDRLRKDTLEVNWKRLKMISDIFNSNVSNIELPGWFGITLKLGLIISKIPDEWPLGATNNSIHSINDVSNLFVD